MSASRRFLYAIKDLLADDVGPIFEAPSDFVAYRQFDHLLSQVDEISKDDYRLYCLGKFEQDKMVLIPGTITDPVERPNREDLMRIKEQEHA